MVAYGELYHQNEKPAGMIAREKMVAIYREAKSIAATARQCRTSRNVGRKWVRRFQAEGQAGLNNRSRRPRHSPHQTPERLQQLILNERARTDYGRKRLAHRLGVNRWTVRNVLRQHSQHQRRKGRVVFYPAFWAWEVKQPFTLVQVDTKDVLDKSGLRTWNYTQYHRLGLPRYQWTFCEGLSRFRLLAYSRELNQTNGLLFVGLVMSRLRAWGIRSEVFWQEDWGQEFGGDEGEKLRVLNERLYAPFGAVLGRAPMGRKSYQGRVERSHRTDDEEF